MSYEKNRFVDNVYALARLRRLKIGDLEKQCGVSTGYLARLRQGKNNISPGAEFLLSISDQLSVSVDALLRDDLSRATASESEVLQYINKLIRDTEARKLSWQEDLAAYPGTVPVNPDGTTSHPLYLSPTGDPSVPFYYHSMFHADLFDLVPVKVYGSIFPDHRTLYLVRVRSNPDTPGHPDETDSWTEMDLVMTGRDILDPIPLSHINHEKEGRLDDAMNRLWRAVEDAAVMPLLTPEARQIISEYLTRDAKETAD